MHQHSQEYILYIYIFVSIFIHSVRVLEVETHTQLNRRRKQTHTKLISGWKRATPPRPRSACPGIRCRAPSERKRRDGTGRRTPRTQRRSESGGLGAPGRPLCRPHAAPAWGRAGISLFRPFLPGLSRSPLPPAAVSRWHRGSGGTSARPAPRRQQSRGVPRALAIAVAAHPRAGNP